jgi:hypothetical protein
MSEDKVAKEVAEHEFERFLELMDIDADMKSLDADDAASFEKLRYIVVKSICRGDTVVNDDGELIFTPRKPVSNITSLTFTELKGGGLKSTLPKKADDNARTIEILCALTRQTPNVFATMAMRDYKICKAIAVLFLG